VTYITVPYQQWGSIATSIERRSHQAQTPPGTYGHPEGAATSLVPSVSITSKTPSSIAFDALYDLENPSYNNPLQKYYDLSKEFCEYLDLCEQKGFVIHGYDYAKGEIHNHFLEYENRWSPGRRGELSDKLDRLEYWFGMQMDRPVTMITLTSYHEGMTIQQQWNELSKSRGKLLKLLAYYYPQSDWKKDKFGIDWFVWTGPDYFWVVEPHKKGYVHFHLAVFADVSNNKKDKYGEGIEDKFRRLWSKKYKTGNHTYGLDFSQKKGDEKLRSLKKYLSKYLQKGFLLDKWTPSLLVFNACLWDTGFRMYGASKNVSHIMNMEGEQENNIVWLETKINGVKKDTQPDGTEYTYEEERIVWYRQYIPDWLDSPFWLQDRATGYYKERTQGLIGTGIRLHNPDKIYIYDWGRPTRDISKGYDPTYGAITYL
jgi:hypothetical protein